jgi:predicted permease
MIDLGVLSELAAVVVPVFICAAIGLYWTRSGRAFDSELAARLVYKISVPCLIIATFARVELTPVALAQVAGAAITVYLVTAALGALVLRAAKLSLPAFLPAMIFALVGSMGLPVCLFAFGDEGLALALVYFTIGALGTFTIGAAIAAGRVSPGEIVREPVIWAILVAVAMLWGDINPPKWIIDTTWLLGGIAIPLQLIALGCSLGRFRIASLPRGIALSVLRLAGGFAIGLGVATLFDLEGVARAVVILQSAMPVAVSNYVFAVIHKREPEEVAGMVLISAAISFFTLPALLLFLR